MSNKVHTGLNDDEKVAFKEAIVKLDEHINEVFEGLNLIKNDKNCSGVFVDTMNGYAATLESLLKESFPTMYTLLDTHDTTFDSEIEGMDK